MKFASVSDRFFSLCSFDGELLENTNRRPYLIIVRLKYNGVKHDFAIPFRSNISNKAPKEQYFSLPPRPTTQKNRIHGLHYIKMFPIRKEFLQKFHTDRDSYYETLVDVINKNEAIIVQEAQQYLINYENGVRPQYSTDIPQIIAAINGGNPTAVAQVAAVKPK